MKNLITNNNATSVQQLGRTTGHGFTWLRLALFAAILIAAAMPAMASCGSFYCTDTINRLYVQPNTSGVLTLYVSLTNGTAGVNCTPQSGVYFTLQSTDYGIGQSGQFTFTQMYDLLLAAKNSHSIVTLRPVTPSNGCKIGYVVQETP